MKRFPLLAFAFLIVGSLTAGPVEAANRGGKGESVRLQAIKKAHPDPNVERRPPDMVGAQALDDKFMELVAKGDSREIAKLFSTKAVLHPEDGAEVSGRDAIEARYKKFFDANTVKQFKYLQRVYDTRRKASVGWGRWTMTTVPKAGGEPVTREGRFTSFVAQRGGKLAYDYVHFSLPVLPPPPAAPPVPPAPAVP